MKRILFILFLFVCTGLSAQQYFFNGTVYVPKTTAQINAISSPQEGRQEYNSTTGTMWVYNGSSWFDTGTGGSGSFLIPVTQAEYDLLTPTEIEENDYAIVDEDDGSGSGGSGIQSVVAGTNISVDNTDPDNPVVSAPDVSVKSSDSGTTGLVLEGSTSGTHTVATQLWSWSRSGDIVQVYIALQTINGASTGTFEINFEGTSIPSYGTNFSLLNVQAYNCPVNFYSIHGRLANGGINKISIGYQDALDGTNQAFITDASFSGGSFVISGTYITND